MASLRLGQVQINTSKIQLERISHVYFEHPDLDDFDNFAMDLGLVKAWRSDDIVLYRGYSKDPYCYVARKAPAGIAALGGAAWIAQTQEDFDKAAAIEGAEVSDLAPYPGGGRRETLKTPSGFLFHVLSGQDDSRRASPSRLQWLTAWVPSTGSSASTELVSSSFFACIVCSDMWNELTL